MAKPNFVSPKGTAAYAWLTKADTKFNPEGVYKTSLVVPIKEAEPFIEAIKNAYVEELGSKKLAKANLSHEVNEEEGTVTFKFKSKQKPKLFDSKGKPITADISVGNGSKIKVAGGFGPYDKGANTGVALYLNSVQIIDLVEWTGSSVFGEEEGGFVATEAAESDSSDDSSDF